MKNLRTGTAKFDTIRAKDANGLSIQDDGGNGLFIKDGGNVGIGTTSPGAKLHIKSSTLGQEAIIVENSLGNETAHIGHLTDGSSYFKLADETGQNHTLIRDNGDSYLNALDGNVGIGHTNPGGKLHVTDLSVSIGDVTVTDSGTGVTGGTALDTKISDGDRIKINGEIFTVSAVAETTLTLSGTPSTSGTYTAYTDSNGLIVTNSGNVGIGTANPGQKLDVNGVGTFRVPTGGQTFISWSQGETTSKNEPVIVLRTSETANQDRVKFHSDGNSYFNGGNVGIGTRTPDFNLSVVASTDPAKIGIHGYGGFGDGTVAAQLLFLGKDSDDGNRNLGHIQVREHSHSLGTGSMEFVTRVNGTENTRMTISSDGNTNIAGQLSGGLGALVTTSNTTFQDWNHSINARAGMGAYLLVGNYSNGPEEGLVPNKYFHVLNFEYSTKNGNGNLSQWAIGYTENLFYMRVRYNSTWTAWTQII